jgi:glycosyltransferase involved in cell wall biosynthesis
MEDGSAAASATLTLCLITRDEEDFLPDCLASASSIVDEIVIFDTGSVDETVNIAHRYGARVASFPFSGSFSEARNAALEEVRTDWVLFLDADERLERSEAKAVRAVVSSAEDLVWGYRLFRYDFYSTGGWFCGPRVKLFRKNPIVRYRGRVHDDVAPSIQENGGRLAEAQVLLDHFGHWREPAKREAKSRRYLALLGECLKDDPNDGPRHALVALQLRNLLHFGEAREHSRLAVTLAPRSPLVWKYRGHVLRSTGDLDEARLAYSRALELANPDQYWERASLMGLIAITHSMQGTLGSARMALEEARSVAPTLPHLMIGVGLVAEAEGDFEEALGLYRRAADLHPSFLLEDPAARQREPPYVSLEYDTVPHYAGLARHLSFCQARVDRGDLSPHV